MNVPAGYPEAVVRHLTELTGVDFVLSMDLVKSLPTSVHMFSFQAC